MEAIIFSAIGMGIASAVGFAVWGISKIVEMIIDKEW